jgi:hypothetical protein
MEKLKFYASGHLKFLVRGRHFKKIARLIFLYSRSHEPFAAEVLMENFFIRGELLVNLLLSVGGCLPCQ